MSVKNKRCYACGAPATSKQHVPPDSFFLRPLPPKTNFITVPSCDAHNHKVKDTEEIFRAFVCCAEGASEHGEGILSTKVLSDHGRTSAAYRELRKRFQIGTLTQNGIASEKPILRLDQKLANEFLKCLTRGFVYKFYRQAWGPELFFRVLCLSGAYPHRAARTLYGQHGSKMTRFSIAGQFACAHTQVQKGADATRWMTVWVYNFYGAVEFMVICTNKAGPLYRD